MKTLNKSFAYLVAAGSLAFAIIAIMHIIDLTNKGLIHWNR